MNNREDFGRNITILVNKYAPLKAEEKKDLIESYMLIFDSQQKIIDELINELEDCTIKKLSAEQEIERLKSKCNNYAKRLVNEGIDNVSFFGSVSREEKL